MRVAQIELIASGRRVRLELAGGEQPISLHLHVLDPTPAEIADVWRTAERLDAEIAPDRVTKLAYHLLDEMVTGHEPDYLVNELLAAMLEYDQREGTDLMDKLSARLWELNGGHYRPSRRS